MNLDKIEIKKLVVRKDNRGYLFEGLREDDKLFEGKFGQCLISTVYKDVIKGFHKHKKQIDYTLCAEGKAIYVASDGKEIKKFLLNSQDPILIKVPPGIWHGYKAVEGNAVLVHIMNTTYDPKDTEEKDPLSFGNVWDMDSKTG